MKKNAHIFVEFKTILSAFYLIIKKNQYCDHEVLDMSIQIIDDVHVLYIRTRTYETCMYISIYTIKNNNIMKTIR